MDYSAFAYGSIKPDLDKRNFKCDHTFEGSKSLVNGYAERLINKKMTVKDFSMNLGVLCHFLCDYFCMHHSKEYWKRDPLAHGIYELKIHREFLRLYNGGRITLNYRCKIENNIESTILKLKRNYELEPKGIMTDISYALAAGAAICCWIVSSSKVYKEYRPHITL